MCLGQHGKEPLVACVCVGVRSLQALPESGESALASMAKSSWWHVSVQVSDHFDA